jgi:hypothetical protein
VMTQGIPAYFNQSGPEPGNLCNKVTERSEPELSVSNLLTSLTMANSGIDYIDGSFHAKGPGADPQATDRNAITGTDK